MPHATSRVASYWRMKSVHSLVWSSYSIRVNFE